MFTKEQINEILAICEKATEGPWEVSIHPAGWIDIDHPKDPAQRLAIIVTKDDADFITLARTALPQLVEDYRKLEEHSLQVEKALDLLLDNLFEMDDETCPADVDGKEFCCDVNICGVERPYKKCWLKFYLDKAKAGEAAGYGGEE